MVAESNWQSSKAARSGNFQRSWTNPHVTWTACPAYASTYLLAVLAAFALAWPLSNHTEVVAVSKPSFDAYEFAMWNGVILVGQFAFAALLKAMPSSTIGKVMFTVLPSFYSAVLTYHTDTEFVEETSHDWNEHVMIAAGIFAALKLIPTLLNLVFPKRAAASKRA